MNTTETKCPKCDSPDPNRHPAVQFEGEVQICDHAFHSPSDGPEFLDVEQGSDEWIAARRGIPTASEFKNMIVRNKKGDGFGVGAQTYMMKVLSERFDCLEPEEFKSADMQRGHDMEEEARESYQFITGNSCEVVGFAKNFDCGASPDSLVDFNGLLEIKTKAPHLQMKVLVAGEVPKEHEAQIQGQLWVTERTWCDFVSYWPGLPLFIKRVERDENLIEKIRDCAEEFNAELDKLEARIREEYQIDNRKEHA